ncbi:MAG: hypothetical protein WCL56_10890 [Sediminibacterium sp.]|jgi:hypothetical protein
MKKTNSFVYITVLLVLGIVTTFIIRTVYFTPKQLAIEFNAIQKANQLYAASLAEKRPTPLNNEHNYRLNWKDYIYLAPMHQGVAYQISKDGVIEHISIPIVNKTEFNIESIAIKIHYINPNNRNKIETEFFVLYNIAANSHLSYDVKGVGKTGIGIICEINKIKSNNFNFCFDQDLMNDPQNKTGISGNIDDPWYCK